MAAGQIETEILRTWLDRQHTVTVLAICTDEDREQWAIPGSIHVNALDALRTGEPGALADTVLPSDWPSLPGVNA